MYRALFAARSIEAGERVLRVSRNLVSGRHWVWSLRDILRILLELSFEYMTSIWHSLTILLWLECVLKTTADDNPRQAAGWGHRASAWRGEWVGPSCPLHSCRAASWSGMSFYSSLCLIATKKQSLVFKNCLLPFSTPICLDGTLFVPRIVLLFASLKIDQISDVDISGDTGGLMSTFFSGCRLRNGHRTFVVCLFMATFTARFVLPRCFQGRRKSTGSWSNF